MSISTTARALDLLQRAASSDLYYSFRSSKMVMLAALVSFVMIVGAAFSPILAPHNTLDLASISLIDSLTPPVWMEDGDARFLLGTDDQGRDVAARVR